MISLAKYGLIGLGMIVIAIVVAVTAFSLDSGVSKPLITLSPTVTLASASNQVEATVARVVDGDTIELSTGEKVRYIGIDTPETVDPRKPVQCLGKEASNKNKELVEGKKVMFEKDVSETDKYGRLLRYVYLDGKMVNETLVLEGYAKSSSYPPDVKYQDKFRVAEATAREKKLGLWSDICNSSTPQANIQAAVTKVPAITPTSKAPGVSPVATTPVGSSTTNVNCSANAYNCTDFSTCSEAKVVFNSCPSDINQLDRDEDGIPCDTLCQ